MRDQVFNLLRYAARAGVITVLLVWIAAQHESMLSAVRLHAIDTDAGVEFTSSSMFITTTMPNYGAFSARSCVGLSNFMARRNGAFLQLPGVALWTGRFPFFVLRTNYWLLLVLCGILSLATSQRCRGWLSRRSGRGIVPALHFEHNVVQRIRP